MATRLDTADPGPFSEPAEADEDGPANWEARTNDPSSAMHRSPQRGPGKRGLATAGDIPVYDFDNAGHDDASKQVSK
ncbi:hypothetical protein O1611_g8148 [Lasiodiplodia mahajangana]|uniref:Uncharacterized protein n=1 Tax=Lasiodiplodia mahajangana TaxID=1108764 RepID=A0ACC2JDM9_9PEZI|nr:hypothetical protein O1611_g8148 [Lasiodiplodia mahajangana]